VVLSWLAIVDRAWWLVMLPRTSGGDRQGEHMTVRAELAAVSGKAIAGFASYVRLSQHRQGHAGTYPRAHHLRLRVALQADHIQAARFQRHRYRLPLPAGLETLAAIAHTLLKIAYQVLKSGKPYEDLGADFYTSRESPEQRRAYLLRQLERLSPGCTITITPAEAA
jgi:hypothetical protein